MIFLFVLNLLEAIDIMLYKSFIVFIYFLVVARLEWMHVTLCFSVIKTFSQVLYNMERE